MCFIAVGILPKRWGGVLAGKRKKVGPHATNQKEPVMVSKFKGLGMHRTPAGKMRSRSTGLDRWRWRARLSKRVLEVPLFP